jgi:hypothetical protein
MEPLTVVELAPGKSVEIEARTRLSLRLKKERPTPAAGTQRSSARKGTKANGAARTSGAAVPDGGSKVARAKIAREKGAGGKGGSGKAGSGKGAASKTARASEARAPSELMNPWPSPVGGQ